MIKSSFLPQSIVLSLNLFVIRVPVENFKPRGPVAFVRKNENISIYLMHNLKPNFNEWLRVVSHI